MEELDRLSVGEFQAADKTPLIVVLDDVRSLNNVGSVFRTADAFRIEKVYLCGITASPPHREIQKTALGATEAVSWEYVEDIQDVIDRCASDVQWIAIEQAEGSTRLQDFDPEPQKRYALVFGNEVKGVKQEVIDRCETVLEIQQIGTKHSLNISVSAGIVLWHFFSRMTIK